MSFTKAKEYLKKYNLEDRIKEFPVSSATVALAAEAIKCTEDEIAKSLSFLLADEPILIIVSGASKIDNKKYKEEFKCKARMIPAEDVEKLIGHGVGGVCPFGINDNVKVYLDVSLKKHQIVYPACGSSNSAVKLNINELEKVSNYLKWVDVCKTNE